MRVLIIEDEKKVSGFIKKGLEEQMFTVDVALDGEAGIRRLHQKEYDIVILDVVLPGMNGFEVCKQIRRIKPGIPVLMLTALGTLDDKVTGLDRDRKSTRLNSSHVAISYAVFCLKK